MYDFCSYIVKPPDNMKLQDLLWVNFSEVDNADITFYTGDRDKFGYNTGASSKAILGMSKSVDWHEKIYIFIKPIDDSLPVNVKFDAVVHIGPEDNWEDKYSDIIKNK